MPGQRGWVSPVPISLVRDLHPAPVTTDGFFERLTVPARHGMFVAHAQGVQPPAVLWAYVAPFSAGRLIAFAVTR